MSFNLALKNIKKSIKDYSIYFFTLVIAVAIFYIFNSLDSQEAMFRMNESKYQLVKVLVQILSYVSVFISVILGFLIVYSNSFLIKRRKKEFGLYLTLGMSKRNVSFILVLETLIVGIVSLLVGLGIGILLSQWVSILTVNLFQIDVSVFKFALSTGALLKTTIYFGLIFIFVMIFNVVAFSKDRIINLLTASKKNEKANFRNKYIILLSFLLSIVLLVYAYKKLFSGAMFSFDNNIIYMLIAGAIGTFLLFFSASNFMLKIVEKIKKLYYKDLNMFLFKQISSSANKSVISTTVICLMLLLTIGILAGSLSLNNAMNTDFDLNNRTDFTINKYNYYKVYQGNGQFIEASDTSDISEISNSDFFDNYVKDYSLYYTYIDDNVTMNEMIDEKTKDANRKKYGDQISFEMNLGIISESDYNNILKLYGMDSVNIDNDEYLLTASIDKLVEFYDTNYRNGKVISINGHDLKPYNKDIQIISLENNNTNSNGGTVVVDDSVIKGLDIYGGTIIGNYFDVANKEKLEDEFFDKCSYFGSISYTTKIEMQTANIGTSVLITFVGLYLGIIFAISSATILAIKELSESSDNVERYHILKQIGADEKMIKKSLLSQIGFSFLAPLIVALFHAFFGLRELTKMIELYGDMDLTKSIFLTALFIVFIYGGYFVATYLASKRIIKEK